MAFHQIHLSVFLQDISNNNLLHNYIPAIPDHLGVALVTPNLPGQSPNLLRPYTITGEYSNTFFNYFSQLWGTFLI